MTEPDSPAQVLGDVFARWRSAFDAGHTDAAAALFTSDALFQGLGTAPFVSRERVREYYGRVPAGTRAEVRVAHAYRLDATAVGGITEVRFTHPGRVRTATVSVVLTRTGGQWLIRHWHAAAAGS